ncbi:N-acetylmuramoyl-L-alanine amidase [Fructilactobacillus florum 8D]|uniref:N-acetylmuramoyl-L-alanine amidase n=2 Tax=Fructilactobacillus florum TaxID=640331 RepID=W9EIT9_9LACO|nr:N-acetylmuramoyl-L-alanine amidase [Fructilactobacillus florum]ETO40885.1 N-acetylmuramoyl-L-alanine amidase [Fructilactobacillus florum 8D]KRM91415.1 N-acetylmuramoyl-L-alanine amidase [Fructilactobacillus florum DSM 22689 = JCM 16035]
MKKNANNHRGLLFTILVSSSTILLLGFLLIRNNLTVPSNNLLVKSGPNLTNRTVGRLQRGERVQILSRDHDWVKVVYHHQHVGWVPNWLLTNHHLKKATPLSEATIVLDPGHGGNDSGALAANGQQEKKYTLKVAQKTKKILETQGSNVILTRQHDQSVSLKKRPKIATKNHANIFISFHFDSSETENSGSGFTSYYYHRGNSHQLAERINHKLNVLPLENKGVQFGDFLVIRDVTVPSVLLEMGYINSNQDFQQINSVAYQNQVATAVAAGIKTYTQKYK